MSLYVLDTDVLGFAFQQHFAVLRRVQALTDQDSVVTTIITLGEDLGGWLPACRRARNGTARSQAYGRLQRGLDFYRRWVCLPFDASAAEVFDELRAKKVRIGTNDLAIAAITLSVGGVLVTRNVVDFKLVAGLKVEDWTQE